MSKNDDKKKVIVTDFNMKQKVSDAKILQMQKKAPIDLPVVRTEIKKKMERFRTK